MQRSIATVQVMNVPARSYQHRLLSVWLNLDDPEKGHAELEDLFQNPGEDASPWQLAEIAANFQETEAAWKWLEAAVAARQPDVVSVQWDPAFEQMRSDPRYPKLLSRMGLKAGNDPVTTSASLH